MDECHNVVINFGEFDKTNVDDATGCKMVNNFHESTVLFVEFFVLISTRNIYRFFFLSFGLCVNDVFMFEIGIPMLLNFYYFYCVCVFRFLRTRSK